MSDLDRIDAFIEAHRGSEPQVTATARALRGLLLEEVEALKQTNDSAEPVAIFLGVDSDGSAFTKVLNAHAPLAEFAYLLDDPAYTFFHISFIVNHPTIFRPYKDVDLDLQLVMKVDKVEQKAQVIHPFRRLTESVF